MKSKLPKLIRRYWIFLFFCLVDGLLLVFAPGLGQKSLQLSWENALEMLSVLPPIFVLLGLMDVWVKRETMVRYMGEGSGLKGILLAFLLGSAAAGPLFAAFPVAVVLLKKGSRLFNVLIFLGAWSTTKLPLILFETTAMGYAFMLTRLVMNLVGITVIAYGLEKVLSQEDKADIYRRAQEQA